jgi:ubiquinone/menaquinone biosynthesis C-methylase UbiE
MKRVVIPEMLDSDAGTPGEVAGSLRDLRMFNRWFGGVRTMSKLLRLVAKQTQLKELSWLDVAGGAGDLATLTEQSLAESGTTLRPVVLDRAPTHMGNIHPAVCGDALALPFRDNSFDVVGSSLFVHHLEPEEILRLAGEALRVARSAFLIHDLMRDPLHLTLSYLGFPLYQSRITRHDAPASVRRAYTVAEIKEILGKTYGGKIEIRTFFLFRMGVIVWKRPNTI